MRLATGLRVVAAYEAAKGVLVLLAGFGLLTLIHRDAHPAKGYPRIFIDAAANVTDARLWLFAGFALAYTAIRWVEAYGLWLEKSWAEWLAVASSAIYIPAELYEIEERTTWLKMLLLAVNVCIVAYLGYVLWRARRDGTLRRKKVTGA
jgi:uncharacterized membrane protein (DUF2068 family)